MLNTKSARQPTGANIRGGSKILLAIFLFGLLYSNAQSVSAQHERQEHTYHFSLTKGDRLPVCNAYLKRLNTTLFNGPPFCGRNGSYSSSLPDFTPLNRVALSPEQFKVLYPRVIGFQTIENQDMYDWQNASRQRLGLAAVVTSLTEIKQLIERGAIEAWKYQPEIDINNDGAPDNVVMVGGVGTGGGGGRCGETEVIGDHEETSFMSHIPYILRCNEIIDVFSTAAIFGHPLGGYRLPNGTIAKEFRPVGKSIGIFKYGQLYYFDTFFDEWGDFENRRKGDPSLNNTLGVFLNKDGKTKQVCEYNMMEIEK